MRKEVRQAVKGNGCPRGSERGADTPKIGRKEPSPPEPYQRLEEEASGRIFSTSRSNCSDQKSSNNQ